MKRGFVRSGNYFYSRNQTMSCCECYQYHCKISEFKPSKSQKAIMKRFHNYLAFGSTKDPRNEQAYQKDHRQAWLDDKKRTEYCLQEVKEFFSGARDWCGWQN